MRPYNRLFFGTAALACTVYAAAAQADPVTLPLFFTTFSGGANVDEATTVTLNGSSLTFGAINNIASTAGADGLLFLPDGNLAIGGQNINNPAQVHEITTGGTAVASVSTTAASNGSYHLALSSNASNATLYTLCNGNCGANFTRFTLSGGGLSGVGTDITVSGGTSQDVRGLIFDPVNSTWYYGTAGDGSTNGTFGTVTFGPGNTATLNQILSNVPAHGLTFDPFTNDIIFSSGNMVDQFDPTSGIVVSTFTDTNNPGDHFDQSAVDGAGHLFIASNNGNLVAIDYDSATGHLINGAGSTVAEKFLAGSLDDIAPLSGIGGTPVPEPASLAFRSGAAAQAGVKNPTPSRQPAALSGAAFILIARGCLRVNDFSQLRHSRVRGSTGFSNGRPSAWARRYSRFRR